MTILAARLLLASLLFTCLASFGWAMVRFFVQPTGTTVGMKLTGACGVIFSILHFAGILRLTSIGLPAMVVAASTYAGALLLFWWTLATNRNKPLSACFSSDQPEHLVDAGPYRFIRHPFYCSYLLTWMAGTIATRSYVLAFTVVVMLAIYINAARNEERKFAQGSLADAYREYQRRTGLFLPNVLKLITARRSH